MTGRRIGPNPPPDDMYPGKTNLKKIGLDAAPGGLPQKPSHVSNYPPDAMTREANSMQRDGQSRLMHIQQVLRHAAARSGKALFGTGRAIVQIGLHSPTVVLIIVGLAGLGLSYWMLTSDVVEDMFPPTSVVPLSRDVKSNPNDATSRLLLGHALYSAHRQKAGLRSYEKALDLDPTVADSTLEQNLLASFGTVFQRRAANLIVKHKIVATEGDLREKLSNKRRAVRLLALRTLRKLGKATPDDRLAVFTMDLNDRECDIRLRAVKNLGRLGEERAIPALQAAGAKDKKEASWLFGGCLDDSVRRAINQIRAKNRTAGPSPGNAESAER